MNTARKLLALNLALLMILTMLPITALAASEPLGPGGSITFAELNEDGYTFTPSETGLYTTVFSAPVDNAVSGGNLIVYDANGNSLASRRSWNTKWSSLSKTLLLRQGTTYTVKCHRGWADSDQYILSVSKTVCPALSSTPIHFDAVTDYFTTLFFQYTPPKAGWYTFSTTESIYLHVYDDYFTGIDSGSADNAGLTVFLESGRTYYLSASPDTSGSISVSPANLPALTTKNTVSVKLDYDVYSYLTFTPDRSGSYTIKAKSDNPSGIYYLNIFSETGEKLAGDEEDKEMDTFDSAEITYNFTAGTTYYIGVYGAGVGNAAVTVGNNEAPAELAQWTKLYPANGATNVGYKSNAPEHYQITFDREIVNDGALADVDLTSDGAFAIYRASDDKLVWKASEYTKHSFVIVYQAENILSITPVNNHILLEPDTEYYITMGEGFVRFKDKSTNQAIHKGDWVFSTKSGLSIDLATAIYGQTISLSWDNIAWANNYKIEVRHDKMIQTYTAYTTQSSFSLDTSTGRFLIGKNYVTITALDTYGRELCKMETFFELVDPDRMPKYNDRNPYMYSFNNTRDYFGDRYYIADEYYDLLLQNEKNIASHFFMKLAASEKWGGSCSGLAAVSALSVSNNLPLNRFQLGAQIVGDLNRPYVNGVKNVDVLSLINYYYLAQFSSTLKGMEIGKTTKALVSELLKDKAPLIVDMSCKDTYSGKSGGHTVVAYRINETFDPNNYLIYIADSNNQILGSIQSAPTIMKISKHDYSISGYYQATANGTINDYMAVKAIKAFYEVSAYEKITRDLLSHNFDNVADAEDHSWLTDSILIATSYSQFSITDGESTSIIDGEDVSGSFDIIPFDFINKSDTDSHINTYLIDSCPNYTIIPSVVETKTPYETFVFSDQLYVGINTQKSSSVEINESSTVSIGQCGDHNVMDIEIASASLKFPWESTKIQGKITGLKITLENNQLHMSSTDSASGLLVSAVNCQSQTSLNIPDVSDLTVTSSSQGKNGDYLSVLTKDGNTYNAPIAYSVLFVSSGGSFVDSMRDIPYGKTIIEPDPPIYGEHTFVGWYKDKDCSPSQKWIFSEDVVTKNTVLYAKWIKGNLPNPPSINPPYDDNNKNPAYGQNGGNTSVKAFQVSLPTINGGTITSSHSSATMGSTVTLISTSNKSYSLVTLTVTDSRGNELNLTDKGNGKYTFTMPNSNVTVSATFQPVQNTEVPQEPQAPQTPQTPAAPWSNPFTDVLAGVWYYEAVQFVSENSLMNGLSSTMFAPDTNLSRAQLAQILYNKEGKPAVSSASSFTDVAPGDWYADAVSWAASKNVVGGYGDGRFGPNDNITREQLAVMLWRYAGEPASTGELTFTDTNQISDFALSAMRWAVEKGILNGKGNGILDPKGLATRAQVAQMLKNYLGLLV